MSQILPTRFKRNSLSILVGLGLTLQTGIAFSQEAAAEDDSEFETIMITASKRLKGLQESPVAITVTSGEAIEQSNVLDIGDLQVLVPTLRVTPLQRSTNTTFSIRGFGNGANNTGIEPSVGIFIDGVYRSRAAASIGDLPKVQQIEVLSGPQSTLFGKNASAGVISVRTEAPSFSSEGRFEAGIGNFNQRILKGYYTNALSDTVAFSVGGGVNTRDGFTDSLVPGIEELNNRDRWNLRGQLLWEATDDAKVRLIADYSEIDEVCCTVSAFINGPTAGAVQALGGVVLDDTQPFAYQSALNTSPQNKVEDGGVSLQVDVDYEDFAFTSITAIRSNDAVSGGATGNDIDYTSLDILRNSTHVEIDTFTQEFRLTSTGERKLDWMVGAFLFNEDVESGDTLTFGTAIRPFFDVLLAAGGAPGLLATVETVLGVPTELGGLNIQPGDFFASGSQINTEFTQENDAYSLFGNFDYNISDKWVATLGISYTNDEKEIHLGQPTNSDVLSSFEFATAPTVFGAPFGVIPTLAPLVPLLQTFQFVPPNVDLPNSVEENSTSDSKTTWSARLAYTVNKNINLFATAATGFKATSWNLSRDTRPFPASAAALASAGLTQPNQTYGTRYAAPEKATVYEMGIKARFKKGAFNATIFNQTIEDFQSSTFVGTGFVLSNAGEQTTKGIEFDSVYRLTDNISLTLAGILLDPIYDSFVGGLGVDGPEDLSGTKPSGIHEQSITAGITYNFELENGMYGYVRSDYIYESNVNVVSNLPGLEREVSTFNASAGLNMENGVKFQVWIRNLNNDEYFLSGFPPPIQAGSFSAYPNQPRTYGASVTYEF
jgi:outer membrane receptor protein involved in Fe transport